MNGRVRRLFLDTAPLRLDRDYRWLWSGQVVNGIGNQITRIALPYQVYVLTGSTLAIAALTLFQLVPILLFALGAGSLADAVDRRRAADGDPGRPGRLQPRPRPPGADRRAAALRRCSRSPSWRPGCRRSTSRPASSSIPRLVPPERLPSAIALNQLNFQMASIVGPAIGGHPHRDGRAGRRLRRRPRLVRRVVRGPARDPPAAAARRRSPGPGSRRSARDSRFARRRRAILGSFVIDLNAMIFGMPTSLFPVLALDVFQTGAGRASG